jgi:hypothetical protein
MQTILITSAAIISLLCFFNLPVFWNLILVLAILIAIIIYMVNIWAISEKNKISTNE